MHQHGPQIPVSFVTDVHPKLSPGVPASPGHNPRNSDRVTLREAIRFMAR
jgi:hypothetical protein